MENRPDEATERRQTQLHPCECGHRWGAHAFMGGCHAAGCGCGGFDFANVAPFCTCLKAGDCEVCRMVGQ